MAETVAPCRQWGAVNLLMRLKNKIREKFFWDRMLTDLVPADSSMHSAATDTQHDKNSAKESDKESAIAPSSHQDLQFYDAMDGSEPPLGQTFSEMLYDGEGTVLDQTFSEMLYDGEGTVLDPRTVTSYEHPEAFLTLDDFHMNEEQQPWPLDAAETDVQRGLPLFSTATLAVSEEYVDVLTELPEEQDIYSAATTSGFGRVETTEMMDTGESSAMAALQPAQWQQIMLLRQFLEIDGVVHPSGGWRVVLSIVSAFRRLSDLVRIRRSQRSLSEQIAVSTPRRIGQGTRYKGIRQRNGKWVSEIRIGGTLEKVWLGSFNTEKEAALAFDAGRHHCSSRRSRNFNFSDSPRLLGAPENLLHLSSVERRTRIQRLAEDHARTYGNANIR